MPATYTFYQNGESILLSKVDDLIREVLGMEPDAHKWTKEYSTLTWLAITYKTFEEILEEDYIKKDEHMVKMIKGLMAKNVTFSNGYIPRHMLSEEEY